MIPVISVADKAPAEPYYCFSEYQESLRRFGHEPTILGFGQPFTGMMSRLKLPLRHMRTSSDEHVIITDCWDMLFLESPLAIVDRFRSFGQPIVFSAERTLFPLHNYGEYPVGTTDSCYLNAGFMVGLREAFIALFEHLDVDNQPDDRQRVNESWEHFSEQQLLHHAFVEQFIPMTLDYESVLCQSMFKTRDREIELGDRIRNTMTGHHPMAIHWNGPAKTDAPVTLQQGVEWWRRQG